MSDTETVSLTFAAWEGVDKVEWEVEVCVYHDGDTAGRSMHLYTGVGAVNGDMLERGYASFERYCIGIAAAKCVKVELPWDLPER